jgi:hypothetical protein
MATELEATYLRHHDVADYDIGIEGNREVESFQAVESGRDLVTFDFEQFNQQIQDLPIVIDNQDSAPL